nr:hypothetical protein TIFTF001_055755 [Ficus carica]GMN73934.1 hypothetical protein TIFTF001_055756 [Ficus carica]GMN74165.1 hypothetical protein TIFTF001_056178 [Ficus carica]GMN74174.1 hypothetical protein TIFTF001_056179 [Ficus carica]
MPEKQPDAPSSITS